MNKFVLAALVAAQTASATVYTAVDDPRCHDEPDIPVLEPTPGPTPYPDPPTNDRIVEYTAPPTGTPAEAEPCTGEVTGFQIYDLDTQEVTDLADGQVIELSSLPDSFTIKAITSGDDLSAVELYLGDTIYATDTEAPYLFGNANFLELNTEGTFTLKGVGPSGGTGDVCSIDITTTYGNPHNCEGIIQQFALYDTVTKDIVPGYSLLENGEVLKKVDLPNPEKLTIIAIDNGRGTGSIDFGYANDHSYHSTTDSPAAITGKDADGNILPWAELNEKEYIRIWAKSRDAMGVAETKVCEIELQIEHDWSCPYTISGFALIQAGTNKPIPGYENILGYKAVDLNKIHAPNGLAIQAHSSKSGVQFFAANGYKQTENYAPYAINGDDGTNLKEFKPLRETGRFVIEAKHKDEGNDKRCQLVLTIQRDYTIKTIDNTTHCAPEAVVPEQVGNVMFASNPVMVIDRKVNETVTFKTVQTIADKTMDWVTTVFVTGAGIEVCDKVENMAMNAISTHQYEANCADGFAFADIYAASSEFLANEATADTSLLPPGCKGAGTKVVKYTFVFPCDCDNAEDVPDEFIGGPNKKEQVCSGTTAYSWGDPHVIPFGMTRSNGWNCQGEGEFVLSKVPLTGYPYDFELRSRFTMFGEDLPWTFNSGMVAAQDVKVQISMGVIGELDAKPNMMDNVPIYFYVDGVPRYFSEGTGDLRVTVYVDGFHVYVTFVETGIQVHVQVRPFYSDPHSGIMNNRDASIPGSFSTYLCLPDDNSAIDGDNVVGLMGTPSASTTDNFMLTDGTPISKPSNLKNYCETNWCITQENDSLFTFETGYDFAHYNKCGSGRRQLTEITEADVEPYCVTDCEPVGGSTFCLEECYANGKQGAATAVLEIVSGEQAQRDSEAADSPDDARCWSKDHKSCISSTTCASQDKYYCTYNSTDSGCCEDSIFLPKGIYELTQGTFADCIAKGGSVGTGETCCPGLAADNGTCVRACASQGEMAVGKECCAGLTEGADGKCGLGRRLAGKEFKFVRLGLADQDNRNIVPLHTEL